MADNPESTESVLGAEAFTEEHAKRYLAELRPYADEVSAEIVDVSRRIHARPEVRFEEVFASGLLTERLEHAGFAVERGIADLPTAFTAATTNTPKSPGGRGDGVPTLGIFCEYDALEGIGHGCGHNVIAAAGLGAALILRRWLADHPETPGRVVVFGSPGEESGGGKVFIIDSGELHGIDAAMMVHPGGDNRAARTGLARVLLEATFTGRAAHAAGAPHRGVNALDAANLTLVAIGLLRQQIRAESRIHAIITDGGQAVNVIPERSAVRMYVRSPSTKYLRDRLLPAVENCARGAALATGAEVELVQPSPAYDSMVSNPALVALSTANLQALGRAPHPRLDGALTGSTDMGNVSRVVPSVHPHIQLAPGLSMHTREAAEAAGTELGDRAAVDGALELAMTAVELLSHPELLREVRTTFTPS